jgi:hypothetical protein
VGCKRLSFVEFVVTSVFILPPLLILVCEQFAKLVDHIKFDHGYTSSSPPVINLLEVIQEFEGHQRRAFLQFITGSPRLPPGGLAALNPKLTVVRKVCFHYILLLGFVFSYYLP